MTQSVSPSLFFSLDELVQLQILKQLPIATLENISLVCKKCLQIKKPIQEAICHNALPYIKQLTSALGSYTTQSLAASVLLSNCKAIDDALKVELIQLKQKSHQFSDFIALIPSYPPAANLAEQVMDSWDKQFSYQKLFEATKNIDYFFKAFPKPMSTIKDPDLWITNYCKTVNVNTFLGVISLLSLLISYAEISSNPKSILEKARTIKNETTALDCFDKFKYSLNIYLVYLKLFPYAKDDDFASLLYADLCNYNTGWPLDNIALQDAITQIVSKNVPLARLFAEKINNPFMTINAHLAIANITKDAADLRQTKLQLSQAKIKSSGALILKTYQKAIRMAISPMKDLSLARELAAHYHSIITDYRAFKAYLRIYKDFKQPEDLKQAEIIAGNIAYAPHKIKAYRALFELTQDVRFYQLGVNVLEGVKPEDKSHALAEAAILTNNPQFFDKVIEIFNNQIPNYYMPIPNFDIHKKNFKICLQHFKDFPRAREYISMIMKNHNNEGRELQKMLASASNDPTDIGALDRPALAYLKPFILDKKFEKAVAFEKEWFNT